MMDRRELLKSGLAAGAMACLPSLGEVKAAPESPPANRDIPPIIILDSSECSVELQRGHSSMTTGIYATWSPTYYDLEGDWNAIWMVTNGKIIHEEHFWERLLIGKKFMGVQTGETYLGSGKREYDFKSLFVSFHLMQPRLLETFELGLPFVERKIIGGEPVGAGTCALTVQEVAYETPKNDAEMGRWNYDRPRQGEKIIIHEDDTVMIFSYRGKEISIRHSYCLAEKAKFKWRHSNYKDGNATPRLSPRDQGLSFRFRALGHGEDC